MEGGAEADGKGGIALRSQVGRLFAVVRRKVAGMIEGESMAKDRIMTTGLAGGLTRPPKWHDAGRA